MKLDDIENETIFKSLIKTKSVCSGYERIACSISGGADSDIMLDLLQAAGVKCKYVFFDTGLEYEATKQHIKYLESRYNIEIKTEKPKIPIPTACKKYGLPFISKEISDKMSRLQAHGFKWEDEDFKTLNKRYPGCKVALRWWCNDFGEKSRYNIESVKGLKEFLIANPPAFKISNKCCDCAKKNVAKKFCKDNKIQLSVVGLRKAEGGARRRLKTCFDQKDDMNYFRPIFWYKNKDKKDYTELAGIVHSACYTVYGLKRTGCAGCPFAQNYENELEIMKKYEPKLYAAALAIFGKSYEYTRKFKEFRRELI